MTVSRSRALSRSEIVACCWALAAAGIYVLVGVSLLRFARDDWNHYVNMRQLHETMAPAEAISQLVDNQWFGAHELRSFFGSFLVHFMIEPLGAAAPHVAYAVQLTMHACAALAIGWVVWRYTKWQTLGIAVALTVLFVPVASAATLWVNNLFFVQPWFLLAMTVLLAWLSSLGAKPLYLFASLTAVACQFSGEAFIPSLYAFLFAVLLRAVFVDRTPRTVIIAAVPPVVAALTFVGYYLFVVVRPPKSDWVWSRLEDFGSYWSGARNMSWGLLNVTSPRYGEGSVAPSALTIALAIAVGLTIWMAFRFSGLSRDAQLQKVIWVIALSAILLAASIVPLIIGIVSGTRTGPDLRYLYAPGIFFASLGMSLAMLICLVLPRLQVLFVFVLIPLVLTYFAFATVYNVVDIWGTQRSVDDRIWAEIDSVATSAPAAIVTYNPNHAYLMAPYHSNAVSDFQADWGVAGRLAWLHPNWPRVPIFRDATRSGGDLALRPYYVDDPVCLRDLGDSGGTVIYVVYDYGSRLSDLAYSPLLVTTSFEEYESARQALIQDQPDAADWARTMGSGACG